MYTRYRLISDDVMLSPGIGTKHLVSPIRNGILHYVQDDHQRRGLHDRFNATVRVSAFLLILFIVVPIAFAQGTESIGDTGFEIRAYEITGNTLLPPEALQRVVEPFTGPRKTAADVEQARDALEKLYHDAGYPAVMVNIPEQTLAEGVIKLQVIESRIGKVKITGNRYFTMEKVMRDLPSFTPGGMLYLPKVHEEIGRLNRSRDIKVEPSITPGREIGTIDVELKIEDRLPLHGHIELNNRASHDTSELRVNAMIRYDNLWQKEHSIALQYQTSPQKPSEVQVIGVSYVLPSPWVRDHLFAFYGIWTDSDTAFGEGFTVIGSGQIFGIRYVLPLPAYRLYNHTLTLGADYKHFVEDIGFTTETGQTTKTPISYLPFSLSYNSYLPDTWGGVTQLSAGLNFSIRGFVSRESEFELKRYKGTANYAFATLGVQRTQKLPLHLGLVLKLDAQVSDQPLINNEQYSAGGMESVRGYKESEALGDSAVQCTVEISFPDPVEKSGLVSWLHMTPFIFYDVAKLTIRDPLPEQDDNITLQGTGFGVRGSLFKNIEFEVAAAVALASTDRIGSGDWRAYFKLQTVF